MKKSGVIRQQKRKASQYGERNPNAKYPDKTIEYIRNSKKHHKELGEELNINPEYVRQIIKNERRIGND